MITYVDIDDYINQQLVKYQPTLQKIRQTIRQAAPNAKEKISYMMPTFWQGKNLVHFAVFKDHFSLFPGGEATAHFADRLNNYKTSKGTIQFPFNKPIDYELITAIVLWTVEQATEKKNKL